MNKNGNKKNGTAYVVDNLIYYAFPPVDSDLFSVLLMSSAGMPYGRIKK